MYIYVYIFISIYVYIYMYIIYILYIYIMYTNLVAIMCEVDLNLSDSVFKLQSSRR